MVRNGSPTTTFGLLDQIRQGDQDAFSILFEKYRTRLAVLIHYKLGDRLRVDCGVEDVVQEVFLAASRDLNTFVYREPGSFMSWLARIADNTLRDLARYQDRKKRDFGERVTLASPSHPLGFEPRVSETPSRVLAIREELRRVLDRLEALPDDYRRVVFMARIECLPTAEIAARLGKTREAVAVLLYRAIQSLKKAGSEGR